MVAGILTALVALAHGYFFWLESVLWNTPKGRSVFRLSEEDAARTAVLASNQGVYNLCLAIGLLATYFTDARAAEVLRTFIFLMIAAVGIYGAKTVSKRILYVQTLPALLALVAVWFIS